MVIAEAASHSPFLETAAKPEPISTFPELLEAELILAKSMLEKAREYLAKSDEWQNGTIEDVLNEVRAKYNAPDLTFDTLLPFLEEQALHVSVMYESTEGQSATISGGIITVMLPFGFFNVGLRLGEFSLSQPLLSNHNQLLYKIDYYADNLMHGEQKKSWRKTIEERNQLQTPKNKTVLQPSLL